MIIFLRVFRVLLAVVGLWQLIGLLPIATWLSNPKAVTLGMAAGVVFKALVALVCAGAYYWLGRLKAKRTPPPQKVSDAGAAGIVIAIGVAAVIVVALLGPSGSRPPVPQGTDTYSAPPTLQSPSVANAASFDAQGWTQESTGSTEVGPWLNYDPPGTRYVRDDHMVIFRLFPPGVRPNAQKANPFFLRDSSQTVPR